MVIETLRKFVVEKFNKNVTEDFKYYRIIERLREFVV